METELHIEGGAGPLEAAAIAAVVQQVLFEEVIAASLPSTPHLESPWVLSGRTEPPPNG
ncbi:MAG: hypothetical protein GXP34_12815 [Actinobacteria bacterium]|nr:hypothetical protein [Actinomycetota bacterium]